MSILPNRAPKNEIDAFWKSSAGIAISNVEVHKFEDEYNVFKAIKKRVKNCSIYKYTNKNTKGELVNIKLDRALSNSEMYVAYIDGLVIYLDVTGIHFHFVARKTTTFKNEIVSANCYLEEECIA